MRSNALNCGEAVRILGLVDGQTSKHDTGEYAVPERFRKLSVNYPHHNNYYYQVPSGLATTAWKILVS